MDDRLRETLSAMMDDEADELSVRRLLSHGGQSDVCKQWQRWQQVRDLMHDGRSPTDSVDVSAGVRAGLDGHATPSERRSVLVQKAPARWRWPAAAMAAVALFVGFGVGTGWQSTSAGPDAPVVASQLGETQKMDAIHKVALKGLDEKQWEYMNRYLLEHAQHNSVGAGQGSVGYARLVSANDSIH